VHGGKIKAKVVHTDYLSFGGYLGDLASPKDEWLRTFAIITTRANDLVSEIHDRMPIILKSSDYLRWLGDMRRRMILCSHSIQS